MKESGSTKTQKDLCFNFEAHLISAFNRNISKSIIKLNDPIVKGYKFEFNRNAFVVRKSDFVDMDRYYRESLIEYTFETPKKIEKYSVYFLKNEKVRRVKVIGVSNTDTNNFLVYHIDYGVLEAVDKNVLFCYDHSFFEGEIHEQTFICRFPDKPSVYLDRLLFIYEKFCQNSYDKILLKLSYLAFDRCGVLSISRLSLQSESFNNKELNFFDPFFDIDLNSNNNTNDQDSNTENISGFVYFGYQQEDSVNNIKTSTKNASFIEQTQKTPIFNSGNMRQIAMKKKPEYINRAENVIPCMLHLNFDSSGKTKVVKFPDKLNATIVKQTSLFEMPAKTNFHANLVKNGYYESTILSQKLVFNRTFIDILKCQNSVNDNKKLNKAFFNVLFVNSVETGLTLTSLFLLCTKINEKSDLSIVINDSKIKRDQIARVLANDLLVNILPKKQKRIMTVDETTMSKKDFSVENKSVIVCSAAAAHFLIKKNIVKIRQVEQVLVDDADKIFSNGGSLDHLFSFYALFKNCFNNSSFTFTSIFNAHEFSDGLKTGIYKIFNRNVNVVLFDPMQMLIQSIDRVDFTVSVNANSFNNKNYFESNLDHCVGFVLENLPKSNVIVCTKRSLDADLIYESIVSRDLHFKRADNVTVALKKNTLRVTGFNDIDKSTDIFSIWHASKHYLEITQNTYKERFLFILSDDVLARLNIYDANVIYHFGSSISSSDFNSRLNLMLYYYVNDNFTRKDCLQHVHLSADDADCIPHINEKLIQKIKDKIVIDENFVKFLNFTQYFNEYKNRNALCSQIKIWGSCFNLSSKCTAGCHVPKVLNDRPVNKLKNVIKPFVVQNKKIIVACKVLYVVNASCYFARLSKITVENDEKLTGMINDRIKNNEKRLVQGMTRLQLVEDELNVFKIKLSDVLQKFTEKKKFMKKLKKQVLVKKTLLADSPNKNSYVFERCFIQNTQPVYEAEIIKSIRIDLFMMDSKKVFRTVFVPVNKDNVCQFNYTVDNLYYCTEDLSLIDHNTYEVVNTAYRPVNLSVNKDWTDAVTKQVVNTIVQKELTGRVLLGWDKILWLRDVQVTETLEAINKERIVLFDDGFFVSCPEKVVKNDFFDKPKLFEKLGSLEINGNFNYASVAVELNQTYKAIVICMNREGMVFITDRDEEKFDIVEKNIDKYIKKYKPSKKFFYYENEPVLVKFADGVYYRAIIKNDNVVCVDTGEVVKYEHEYILPIYDQKLVSEIPPLGVFCRMNNLDMSQFEDYEELMKRMHEMELSIRTIETEKSAFSWSEEAFLVDLIGFEQTALPPKKVFKNPKILWWQDKTTVYLKMTFDRKINGELTLCADAFNNLTLKNDSDCNDYYFSYKLFSDVREIREKIISRDNYISSIITLDKKNTTKWEAFTADKVKRFHIQYDMDKMEDLFSEDENVEKTENTTDWSEVNKTPQEHYYYSREEGLRECNLPKDDDDHCMNDKVYYNEQDEYLERLAGEYDSIK